MYSACKYLTKIGRLSALLLLPAHLCLAHGQEEYHWLEHEYREELYPQLAVIASCLVIFGVLGWAIRRFKRRTICKG